MSEYLLHIYQVSQFTHTENADKESYVRMF